MVNKITWTIFMVYFLEPWIEDVKESICGTLVYLLLHLLKISSQLDMVDGDSKPITLLSMILFVIGKFKFNSMISS